MPELRFNRISGDWVIIAPERAKRPEEFGRAKAKTEVPAYDPACPFCPGNEDQAPPERFRLRGKDGGWAVRSVPNKFSALTPEGEAVRQGTGLKKFMRGVGLHEVIIETPDHGMTTSLLPLSHVEQILRAYKDRFLAFYRDSRVEHVIIFKNHGQTAGTSLQHPHSQIVGTPVVPGQVRNRVEEALRNYGDFGECVYCWCLKEELREGVRIVKENASFVAFVPYAALTPFHLWIFPKRHTAYFGNVTDSELSDLASILKEMLHRLDVGLGNPDLNYVTRSLSPADGSLKYFHWYVSIVPRLATAAGFELGTGMYINTTLPEHAAQFLREANVT